MMIKNIDIQILIKKMKQKTIKRKRKKEKILWKIKNFVLNYMSN